MEIEIVRERLQACRLVPIITVKNVERSVALVDLLAECGIGVVEIVLRTPQALEVVDMLRRRHRDLLIGAGTVLNAEQYEAAVAAGADFTVSPGYDPDLATYSQHSSIPLVPGVQTASEVMRARTSGFRLLKFYPAVPANGIAVLSDFANIFPDVAFMPTGKVTRGELPDFVRLANVVCVGGSWMYSENGEILDAAEIASRVTDGMQTFAAKALP